MADPVDKPAKLVIQISDTHITGAGNLHEFVDTLDNLASILSAVEASTETPDLLLFTGDLADKGEPEAYRRFRATVEPFAARIGAPTLFLMGNHDDRPAFRAHLLEWEENSDPVDQVFWSDALRVIALDSTVPGSHYGALDDVQLSWLADELATPAPLGTILALHHPPIPGPSEFLNELILRDADALGEVIAGTDVTMIVSGHAHHASAGVLAGVPVWVATASAYQMDVLAAASVSLRGIPGSAFTRLDVFPGGTASTNVPMIAATRAVYDIDFETIRRWTANGGVSAEEIEAAFAPSPVGS